LINYLNKYHPFLFYLNVFFVANVLTLFSKICQPSCATIHWRMWKYRIFLFEPLRGFIVIIFTLMLGSWWAFQEASWGGWWNWDFSELLGVIFLYLFVNVLHLNKNITQSFHVLNTLLIGTSLLCFSYLFLQLNFKTSSHNFGEKFFFFYNNNFLFIEFACFSFLWCMWLIWIIWGLLKRFGYFNCFYRYNTQNFMIYYALQSLCVFIFFYSASPLITSFIWIFFNHNTEVTQFFLHPILILLFLCLFIYLFCSTVLVVNPSHIYIISVLSLIKLALTITFFLHFSLLWFFAHNLISYGHVNYRTRLHPLIQNVQFYFLNDWHFIHLVLNSIEINTLNFKYSTLFIMSTINIMSLSCESFTIIMFETVLISKSLLIYNTGVLTIVSIFWMLIINVFWGIKNKTVIKV